MSDALFNFVLCTMKKKINQALSHFLWINTVEPDFRESPIQISSTLKYSL